MSKTNQNITDLKSFGKKSLRIIFSMLEDIKAKMEITQINKKVLMMLMSGPIPNTYLKKGVSAKKEIY